LNGIFKNENLLPVNDLKNALFKKVFCARNCSDIILVGSWEFDINQLGFFLALVQDRKKKKKFHFCTVLGTNATIFCFLLHQRGQPGTLFSSGTRFRLELSIRKKGVILLVNFFEKNMFFGKPNFSQIHFGLDIFG